MADLRPVLPQGFAADIKIDVADARYQAVRAVASESGMSQAQFSDVLGMEARRAMEHSGIASAPVNRMSFAQKMVAADAMRKAKQR